VLLHHRPGVRTGNEPFPGGIAIANRLVISVHTVQAHLRNVFTKTGVRAGVILLPRSSLRTTSRVRDNEERTAANLPLRGGPDPNTRQQHSPDKHRAAS
jgi:hypothetical protein